MKSMTAFARAETVSTEGRVTLEIRSVNSRYLDLNLRVPEDFRQLEPIWRELLQKRLSRGKVELSLRYQIEKNSTEQIRLNDHLVGSLVEVCHQIEEKMNNPARMTAMDLLRWQGVVQDSDADMQVLVASAKNLLGEALDEFIANREREGAAIKEMIQQRLDGLEALVKQVQERRPQVVAALRQRMHAKLEELPTKVDEQRLEQELVLYAQKLDVDEELDRLNAHIKEMHGVLQRKEPIGRRLDFLMQEFNREANTLSSKSSDVETTQVAVDMKVLIEQMREQIQNIE